MEDNFYLKYNESLNSLVANNSEFKIKHTNKIQDFFIGKIIIGYKYKKGIDESIKNRSNNYN